MIYCKACLFYHTYNFNYWNLYCAISRIYSRSTGSSFIKHNFMQVEMEFRYNESNLTNIFDLCVQCWLVRGKYLLFLIYCDEMVVF